MLEIFLTGLVLIVLTVGLAVWLATGNWHRDTAGLVKQFTPTIPDRRDRETQTASFKDFDRLPAPVAKYFRLVLKEGQPHIRSANLTQVGEFQVDKEDNSWSQFEAKQYFSANPPSMVWDARIRMAPLLDVQVRDAYMVGQGSMQAKILALVPVVNEHSKPELNAGALQRYLAELVWLPTALLPSDRLKWSAIDSHKALATLTDNHTTVSLEFRFNDLGEITGVFAPARYREVNGKYEPTPWAGYFYNYQEKDGMRIPTEGYVEWQLGDRAFPYWKGKIVEVNYDFMQ
jgi:hypothetical protein